MKRSQDEETNSNDTEVATFTGNWFVFHSPLPATRRSLLSTVSFGTRTNYSKIEFVSTVSLARLLAFENPLCNVPTAHVLGVHYK